MPLKKSLSRRERKKKERKERMRRFILSSMVSTTVATTGVYGLTQGLPLRDEVYQILPANQPVAEIAKTVEPELHPTETNTATVAPIEDTDRPSPTPTSSPTPTDSPTLTATATQVNTLTPYPTQTPYPTSTPYPTQTPYPTSTPYPEEPPSSGHAFPSVQSVAIEPSDREIVAYYRRPLAKTAFAFTAVIQRVRDQQADSSEAADSARQAAPTYTAMPTYTVLPTYTPQPTYTALPTHTRTPTSTATSTATATSIAITCRPHFREIEVNAPILISGQGVPGQQIYIYANDSVVGEAIVGAAGAWQASVQFSTTGQYAITCQTENHLSRSISGGIVLVSRPLPTPTQIPEGLVGFWALDELNEVVGNELDGELTFAPSGSIRLTSDVPLVDSLAAFTLNGIDQYLVANQPASTTTDDLTMVIWVKWAGQTGDSQLIFYNGIPKEDGYGLCTSPEGLVQVQVGAATLDTDVTLSATWQALVLVRKEGEWLAYRDGTLLTISGDATPQIPTLATFIGGENIEKESGFKGLVDHVSFYERALSADEIQELLSNEQ